MGTEAPETIKVCTVVIKDDAGRVLTVRKRGTNALMLPGGKPEQGESVKDTAAREVAEELGVALDLKVLHELGSFSGPAANEHGCRVHATVFEHPYIEVAAPRAEIEHTEWVDPGEHRSDLAPLLRNEVFPFLRGGRDAETRVPASL